jgi:hypothetical protein
MSKISYTSKTLFIQLKNCDFLKKNQLKCELMNLLILIDILIFFC